VKSLPPKPKTILVLTSHVSHPLTMTDALDSGTPSIDSPTTPVNNHHDLKIDIEFTEESDVRNEPLPVKVSSTFPELGTPVNPGEHSNFRACTTCR
jgi:hypothetical protein